LLSIILSRHEFVFEIYPNAPNVMVQKQ